MKRLSYILFLFILLSLAVPAMAKTTSEDSKGLKIEVVNKSGKELDVLILVKSWDTIRTIEKTVPIGETIIIPKAETEHPEGIRVPHWEIFFNNKCRHRFNLNRTGKCSLQVGSSACGYIKYPNEKCSIQFVTKKP